MYTPTAMRRRRWFAACLGLGVVGSAVLLGSCHSRSAPRYDRPPIIVFDIDTLRADHLGCYGYERNTSPVIDRFAADSALFEWTFAQGPNTPPSQSSILTALYPSSHGRIVNRDVIRQEVETMAEVLAEAGYETAAFVDGGLMAAGFGLEQGFGLFINIEPDPAAPGIDTDFSQCDFVPG